MGVMSRSMRRVAVTAVIVSAALALPARAQDPQATRTPERTQPPLSEFLDTGFGTEGLATTSRFGGDRSAMALQPDGAVVMVGGTFVDFVMARFLADGTLDPGFGEGGMVTTDIQPDQQEEALAVALDPDGRIVVAGYSGFDATMALARYLPDGSLDPAFGTGGIVGGHDARACCTRSPSSRTGGSWSRAGSDIPDGTADFSDLLLARFRAGRHAGRVLRGRGGRGRGCGRRDEHTARARDPARRPHPGERRELRELRGIGADRPHPADARTAPST